MPDPITTPDPATTDPRAAENADKTFTQAEVTAFLAREKDQGDRAGKSAVAAALNAKLEAAGFTGADFDSVIALAAAAKTAEDAAKTETQRALESATATKAAADKDRADAANELHVARLTAALGKAGAQNVDVATRAIVVAPGADAATITAAIAALKTDAPGLFTAATPAPHSDGGTPPTTPASGVSAKDRAAKIAEARGWKPTA